MLQFAAGLAVVLDLIGPERLRLIGRRATEVRGLAVAGVGRALRGGEGRGGDEGAGEGGAGEKGAGSTRRRAGDVSVPLVVISVFVGITALARDMLDFTVASSVLRAVFWAVATILTIFLAVVYRRAVPQLVRLALVGFLGLLSDIFLRPLAFVLDNANPGHLVRWAAVAVFVAGFMLDLLGS
jgi:hypothetical protein